MLNFKPQNWILKFSQTTAFEILVIFKSFVKLIFLCQNVKKFTKSQHLWGLIYKAKLIIRRCSVKQVFLDILKNSRERTCGGVSFFDKVTSHDPVDLLKKTTAQAFLRTRFLQIDSVRLLLNMPNAFKELFSLLEL